MKFKVGDKVKCTNIGNQGYSFIKVGGIYTINKISLNGLSFEETRLKSGGFYYPEHLFEKVGLTIQDAINSGKRFRLKSGEYQDWIKLNENGKMRCIYGREVILDKSDLLSIDWEIEENPPLKINNYTLEKIEDGSIKVGCQTISKEDVEKIKEFLAK